MPRYFFHTRDGVSHEDHTGMELSDLNSAGIEAMRYMSELLRDESADVWRNGELELTISDERGAALCVLTVAKRETGAGV